MREIKFRVWDKEDGEMIYKTNFNNYEITLEGEIHFYQNCPDGEFGTDYLRRGENIFLMQYTNLKDKNGKGIYEGDIVKDGYGEPTGKVIFEEGCFVIESLNKKGYTHYPETRILHFEACEVIGNIYENPELLENKQ